MIRYGGLRPETDWLQFDCALSYGLGGNESYPDLFQPFGGFPDGLEVVNGFITMPDLPGIGFEAKADLSAVMRQRRRCRAVEDRRS